MRNFFIINLILGFIVCSCSSSETEEKGESYPLSYTVERAPEWTALFKRTSGWFGGDGIFAIPLSGNDRKSAAGNDSLLFVFSDTMFGEIKNDSLQPGFTMVNNSMALLRGSKPAEEELKFMIAKDKEGKPATAFVPATPAAQAEDYYWLGDGFVNTALDNDIYLFAYRIRNTNTDDLLPFEEVGNAILVLRGEDKFPFKMHRQLAIPFFSSTEDSATVSFGVGVFENTAAAGVTNEDGYIYIYGVRGKAKELVAARTKPINIENFSSWEFWSGDGWSSDHKTLAAIADSVSNELSISRVADGKYALIYQYGGIFPEICMQIGPTPVGPFGPREVIWNTTNDIKDPDLFTYNAKAHPAISKPGELIVSYNVNSFKFFEIINRKPNLYRPRFIRIKFNSSN